MSEMIERVARAIYEGRNGRGCKPWGNLPGAHKEPYLKDAQAAITALDQYRNIKSWDHPECIQCGAKSGEPCMRDHREPTCWAESPAATAY